VEKISRQYRQGDVLLHPIAAIPDGAARRWDGVVTLAEGELTGHSHTIEAPPDHLESYDLGGSLYLLVRRPVRLRHQTHGAPEVDPGAYEVRRQTEVWLDEVRRVAD